MRLGKEVLCIAAGLALCLALGGCFTMNDPRPRTTPDIRAAAPSSRPAPDVPSLRIPRENAAATTEIPVVPLPIPPADRQDPPRSTAVPTPIAPAGPAAPSPVAATPASVPPPASTGMDNIRQLQRTAAERYAHMDSYIARMTRREQVRGENKPEEVMLFKFRKEPWSVYLKWLGTNGRGREVIYVKGQYESKIHTLLAAGDMPLAPAGKRMSLSPDNMLVRSASRHPIYEAGFGASIERIGRVIEALDRGDQRGGTLIDLGLVNRPEFVRPVAAIEHVLPVGADVTLPRGGRRIYFFDPDRQLPVLLVTRDHLGQEVEYYYYDRLQFPVRLDDNDFNPDKLWGKMAPRQ